MSKQQFNNFLFQRLKNWFQLNIKQGNKYRFYSDDIDQIKSLVDVLEENITGAVTFNDTVLKYIIINNTKLIYVNDIDNSMNEHFISTLRDEVSSKETKLKDCALFILHTSRLDTLISTAIDLTISGHPPKC